MPDSLLPRLERYYDAAPRTRARVEEVGPFTLFIAATGHPYYARPRLGAARFAAADVRRVLARQRELGVPQALEWVAENTPTLAAAADEAGMSVTRCPLLVLDGPPQGETGSARMLDPEEDEWIRLTQAAISLGFDTPGTDRDNVGTRERDAKAAARDRDAEADVRERMRTGRFRLAAAVADSEGPVGGGSFMPVDGVAEVTGVGVLPAFRRRGLAGHVSALLARDAIARGVHTVFCGAESDAVARVYERVGFRRVGTACVAETPTIAIRSVDGRDWRQWREIRLRALQDSPTAFGTTYEQELANPEELYRERLDADVPTVLALAGDRTVGMAGGFSDRPGWLLVVSMWVDPQWRGRGVGRRMLDHIVTWAEERSLRVHLDVTVGNAAARRLYEEAGFQPTGESRPLRAGADLRAERLTRRAAAGRVQ